MKFPRLSFVLAAALAALLSSAPRAFAAVANGQPAPDFTLTDLDGQVRHLSDYKGKIVVLEWNNPDCPIVHKHYDSGNIPGPLQKAETAKGVVWLLINSGAPGKEGADYSAAEIQGLAWKARDQIRRPICAIPPARSGTSTAPRRRPTSS